MSNLKAITGVLCIVVLLAAAGCNPEPETTTITSTITAQASTTTITTTVNAQPVTTTQTTMVTTTVTETVATSPTTTTPTTTSGNGFEPVVSADGKLRIIEANYEKPYISDNLVVGIVENTSDETLDARITVEFLNASGAAAQTKWVIVRDIAPGAQENFTVKAELFLGEFAGFNIYVEVAA